MITDTGVWFAKMYAASTVPTGAEYEGTNYADFSQVDSDNNPIIVIYEYQSGSWVETERVTPPANYDGYVPVTKKMWDIIEQTGQQGGRVLWNHQSKEFTPYPNIVDLSNVATTDLDNLTTTGKANVSEQGTYDSGETYSAGTVGAAITSKANTDMDNLTDTGKNIGNWSSNVTNCITEIPQDIKLELNNGTLTLKAGSKVYVPNGAGVFDTITIASDISVTKQTNEKCFVYYANNSLYVWEISNATSGTTVPSGTGTWYDTTNNLIKRYVSGSMTLSGLSFPLAILDVDSTAIQNIDQVFNGFGYIGSTWFALPGVKGLISDGRNADGTLKNTAFTIENVLTETRSNWGALNRICRITGTAISSAAQTNNAYNKEMNLWYNPSTGLILSSVCIGSLITNSSHRITSLTVPVVYRALDFSDTEYLANCAMPSGTYIDMTLGASGTDYIAPADGWFFVDKTTGTANAYLNVFHTVTGMGYTVTGPAAGNTMRLSLPVAKGDTIRINYNMTGTTEFFRFVYAVGAQ